MLNTQTALQPYNQVFTQAVQQSYLDSLRNRERANMEQYIKAREYYDGIHNTQLTDRMREFLGWHRDSDFTVNYCPMVVNAKADRLKVTGFEIEDNPETQDTCWKWWRKNRLDRKQNIVHHTTVNDADTFVLIEWDDEADIPRFHHEPAFAGDGMMVYYSEERRDEIEFASKSWRIEHGANAGKMRRLNLYFSDRIEKYVSHDDENAGRYMPYDDPDDPTQVIMPGYLGQTAVNWWTDNGKESGKPLGVPVVHFKNNDTGDGFGTSQLANVMPIQDALNKAMIDLLSTMDTEAFGLLVGTGTDAWADVKVGPGAVASVNKDKNLADLKRLQGTDPTGLLNVYNALVMEIARVSGTPLSYIQSSGQVAAEGTMKQQEIALVTQVEKAQTDFGNCWEDCMMIAIRLHNAFSDSPEIDTDIIIDTVWEQAESRNDKEQAETLAIKVSALGVSEEQAQVEMGYDAIQIASFERAKRRSQALAIRTQANTFSNAPPTDEDNAQTLTQTETEQAA